MKMVARMVGLELLMLVCVTAMHAAPLTKKQCTRLREEIRQTLDVPDTLPPLDAKVWGTFSPMRGVLADRVTYNTADGMMVTAIVYRPDSSVERWKGRLPGIVMVNGHRADKFSWYSFYTGMLFAKAGAVVVTYDPIGEGERNQARRSMESPSPHDALVTPPAGLSPNDWGQRLAGLMQVDLLQAVSYLEAQPEVDPHRIATLGYSMGAFVAGIEGAYDTRVHAVLISGGGVFDGPGGYYDSNRLPCQGPPYRALSVLGDRGAVIYALNARRGPMLVMNGLDDRVMDIPQHGPAWFATVRTRAVALNGSEKNMFTTIFYPGVGHRPSWLDRDGVEWLNQQLHFAFWDTDAKIEAQGLTHIAAWVQATGAPISPGFIRPEREGGIEAVGKDFPAVPRAELMVLPTDAWEKMKDRLTYEAWAAKMKAQEQVEARKRTASAGGS